MMNLKEVAQQFKKEFIVQLKANATDVNTNPYLTDDGYASFTIGNAKRFDTEEEARQFARRFVKGQFMILSRYVTPEFQEVVS